MTYTAPAYNALSFDLGSGYTAPTYNDVGFDLSGSTVPSCSPESIVTGGPEIPVIQALQTYAVATCVDVIGGLPVWAELTAYKVSVGVDSVVTGVPIVPWVTAESVSVALISVITGGPIIPNIAALLLWCMIEPLDTVAGEPVIEALNVRSIVAFPSGIVSGEPDVGACTAYKPATILIDILTGTPIVPTVLATDPAGKTLGVWSGSPIIPVVTVTQPYVVANPAGIVSGTPNVQLVTASIVAAKLVSIVAGQPVVDDLVAHYMVAIMDDLISGVPVVPAIAAAYEILVTENAVLKYFFTLTGTPDVEIPFSSFQGRLRSGASSYLSVIVPGLGYADEITDRADGEMIIEAAYYVNGSPKKRTEIARANLNNIRVDTGTRNKSITLTGYKQQTFIAKSVTLADSTYSLLSDGKYRYRFAEPDLDLNPGDTVIIGSVSFVADVISYYVRVSEGKTETQMEVSES